MKTRRGDGSVFQRGGVWWIKYYRNGKAFRESSGSEKESGARKLLKRRLGEIAVGRFIGPDAEKVTIRKLSDDYLNDYQVNSKKSLDKAQQTLKHVLPFFGDYRAHDVGTDLVRKYISSRQEEGAENATINRELSGSRECSTLACRPRRFIESPISRCCKRTT